MKTPFGRRSFGDWRWWLASWLSYFACRLRRQKWYLADTWHGVPGNRAAELEQQLWVECVSQISRMEPGHYQEFTEVVEPKIRELSQLAHANFGHVPNPEFAAPASARQQQPEN